MPQWAAGLALVLGLREVEEGLGCSTWSPAKTVKVQSPVDPWGPDGPKAHPVTYFMPALQVHLLSTYYVPGTESRPGFIRRFYRWKGTQFLPSQRDGWVTRSVVSDLWGHKWAWDPRGGTWEWSKRTSQR